MGEQSGTGGGKAHRTESESRDELRTIAFRLRELQRLMSIRVEQENRKLEAEGIEPVTDRRFIKDPDPRRSTAPEAE